MPPKSLRRLEVSLPEDHPIWNIPKGSRAAVAREWLDIGVRLSAIEERLDALGSAPPDSQGADEERPKPDIGKFLDGFN